MVAIEFPGHARSEGIGLKSAKSRMDGWHVVGGRQNDSVSTSWVRKEKKSLV